MYYGTSYHPLLRKDGAPTFFLDLSALVSGKQKGRSVMAAAFLLYVTVIDTELQVYFRNRGAMTKATVQSNLMST